MFLLKVGKTLEDHTSVLEVHCCRKNIKTLRKKAQLEMGRSVEWVRALVSGKGVSEEFIAYKEKKIYSC